MVEDLGNEAVIRLELGTHAAVFCNWRHMADDMAIRSFGWISPCYTMKQQYSTRKHQLKHNFKSCTPSIDDNE